MDYSHYGEYKAPWYDVRSWRRRTWAVVAAVVVVLVVVIAVPAAVVSKRNSSEGRYPDYVKLNYTLRETCEYLIEANSQEKQCGRLTDYV